MKRWLWFGVLVLFLAAPLFSQARRIVLLEEATNASCAPCAANNPNLQAFFSTHFGGVVSVRYHAWWPGYDPMYQLNTGDNTARINYYGISGVPNYMLDGANYGVPGDPAFMAVQMRNNMAQASPVKIAVSANISAGEVVADIKVIALANVTPANLWLRTAVIERMVVYANPPGSNGERDFPDVLRKLLPDPAGMAIPALNAGDTLSYQLTTPVNPAWNWPDLAVVSWLQSDATQEVLQANISLPTFIVETADPLADLLDPNQAVTKSLHVLNDNPQPVNLNIAVNALQISPGWSYSLLYNGAAVDSIAITLAPNETLNFELEVLAGPEDGSIKLSVLAKNQDDPYGYGYAVDYFGLILSGEVLFVDDDGGENYEYYYYAAFDSAGIAYTSVEQSALALLAYAIPAGQFAAVVWNVSWGFPALTPEDVAFLSAYLDSGGNLFIAGQDIGWDIFDPSGSSNFPAAQSFYHTYLDANYLSDNAAVYAMQGIPGDPITDGLAFNINTIYSRYPEQISSFSGNGALILKYTNSSKYGAIRYDSGNYMTVYSGVGLEQMSDSHARIAIVGRALNWFGITGVSIDPEPGEIPRALYLAQNYPNPFNPSTAIRFGLPQNGEVRLTIYNILGERVAELANGTLPAGQYTYTWDGRNHNGRPVASGMYFYRLESEGKIFQKKMLLVR